MRKTKKKIIATGTRLFPDINNTMIPVKAWLVITTKELWYSPLFQKLFWGRFDLKKYSHAFIPLQNFSLNSHHILAMVLMQSNVRNLYVMPSLWTVNCKYHTSLLEKGINVSTKVSSAVLGIYVNKLHLNMLIFVTNFIQIIPVLLLWYFTKMMNL